MTFRPKLYYLKDLLTRTLDNRFEANLLNKPTSWKHEALLLPYSNSLKSINFNPFIEKAQQAIPPVLRRRLSIKIILNNPMPIGHLLANNAFGKMTLKQKQDEEMICSCADDDKVKFKPMRDCDHVITTNPEVIKDEFPIIYDLCKEGGKFRLQTKVPKMIDFYRAIERFRVLIERKYGNRENELFS